jgi:hypothetical protein
LIANAGKGVEAQRPQCEMPPINHDRAQKTLLLFGSRMKYRSRKKNSSIKLIELLRSFQGKEPIRRRVM